MRKRLVIAEAVIHFCQLVTLGGRNFRFNIARVAARQSVVLIIMGRGYRKNTLAAFFQGVEQLNELDMAVVVAVAGRVAAEDDVFAAAFCNLSEGSRNYRRAVLDCFLVSCVVFSV